MIPVRKEKLPKAVRYSATAVLFVGLTEEGIITFTNGKNVDGTVVIVSLSFQLKIHTYIGVIIIFEVYYVIRAVESKNVVVVRLIDYNN